GVVEGERRVAEVEDTAAVVGAGRGGISGYGAVVDRQRAEGRVKNAAAELRGRVAADGHAVERHVPPVGQAAAADGTVGGERAVGQSERAQAAQAAAGNCAGAALAQGDARHCHHDAGGDKDDVVGPADAAT